MVSNDGNASFFDFYGHDLSLGYGGAAGFGLGVMGSFSIAIDDNGNYIGLLTLGGGGSTPAAGGGFQLTVTNADKVSELTGMGVEGGVSAAVAGLEGVVGATYTGVSISAGANNVLVPFEIHGYGTYTWGVKVSSKQIRKFKKDLKKKLSWLNKNLTKTQKKGINKIMGENFLKVS